MKDCVGWRHASVLLFILKEMSYTISLLMNKAGMCFIVRYYTNRERPTSSGWSTSPIISCVLGCVCVYVCVCVGGGGGGGGGGDT